MRSTHNIVSFTPREVTPPVRFNIFIIRCCTGKVHDSLGVALPAAVDAGEDAQRTGPTQRAAACDTLVFLSVRVHPFL